MVAVNKRAPPSLEGDWGSRMVGNYNLFGEFCNSLSFQVPTQPFRKLSYQFTSTELIFNGSLIYTANPGRD